MGIRIPIPGRMVLQNMKEGDVYFFDKNSSLGVPNHLHVCVVKGSEKEPLIFACCTSQEGTMNKLIKKQNLSSDTIIYMNKDSYPFLTDDTFVNCNSLFPISMDSFVKDWNDGHLEKRDSLGIGHFDQIVNGVLKSVLVEEEYKDMISQISFDDYQK